MSDRPFSPIKDAKIAESMESGDKDKIAQAFRERFGLSPDKLSVEDWVAEQNRLEDELKAVQQKISEHRRRCSHKYSNGETRLFPTGYGDAMCRTCRTQTD